MFYLKLTITGFLVVTIYGLVTCKDENITNEQLAVSETNEQFNDTLQVLTTNKTNLRAPRTLVPQLRTPTFTLRRRQPIQIHTRADHLPLRTQMRRVHNSLSNGQPTQPQSMRLGFESLKISKFMPNKVANLPFPNHGKGSVYRPHLKVGHPNAIHVPALSQQYMHNFKASPAFNGQIKVHPVEQTQKQQPAPAQKDNSYPKYIKPQQLPAAAAAATATALSPQAQSQKPQQHIKPSLTKYSEFKQYPIPDQEKMQQHNEQHEKYLQQQKFLTPKNPIAYYQQQHHQELPAVQPQQNYPVQQPLQYLPQTQYQLQPIIPIHESMKETRMNSNINNVAFPSTASVPLKMYSVYEENDMTELQTNNYQTASQVNQGLDKDAQEYLRFMNSDEYFLPKKEPNYKRIDGETDKRQFNVMKSQAQQHPLRPLQQTQSSTAYQSLIPKQQQQQHKALHPQIYTPSAQSPKDVSVYKHPKPISKLFYQQDPSASASSTVVRTSYHTGQNQFAANSKDKKFAKYTMPPSSTTISAVLPTQPTVVYPQLRYNLVGNRTPEPLRFEFTERDAMVGSFSYTNAPQAQLRYKEFSSNNVTPRVESSTRNYLNVEHQTAKPVFEEGEDDPEEGDDTHNAGNSLFDRQPVGSSDLKANKVSSTTEVPHSEHNDTEEYCERICAIVEDENEEIVCGSDGYMYTSEAQMECYASCLHIDVTIQGKGSCSTQ